VFEPSCSIPSNTTGAPALAVESLSTVFFCTPLILIALSKLLDSCVSVIPVIDKPPVASDNPNVAKVSVSAVPVSP